MNLNQVPATASSIRTMSNRSLRISFDTQENLTDEQIGKLGALHEKYGWLCFLPDTQIKEDELLNLPALPKSLESSKSPAQRLYGALYVYWEQQGKSGEFRLFYERYMEKRINEVKEKLT
jgi:hypothetical protein